MRLSLRGAAALLLAAVAGVVGAAPAHAADRPVVWSYGSGEPVAVTGDAEVRFDAWGGAQLVVDCSYAGTRPWGQLVAPSGETTRVACADGVEGRRHRALELLMLSESGVYRMNFSSGVNATFWITALESRLHVPAAGGAVTEVSPDAAPRNAVVSFRARAGERVYLECQSREWRLETALFGPDHKELPTAGSGSCATHDPRWGDPNGPYWEVVDAALPADGEYRLVLNYDDYRPAYSTKVKFYRVPADLTGTLTANGGPLALDLAPGQNATVTFILAEEGWPVLYCGQSTSAYVSVTLRAADGSLGMGETCEGDERRLYDPSRWWGQEKLPAGTYTLRIDPSDRNAASLALRLG
ncbi:hypothetical protein AB0M36_04830 [Actinoplanes sp. NPDC051346]|uniref:hypothetical protein n=1 Tax=Actinoplanes sp. NPDC051346 TaxID=3155048 RepID=UPI00341A909C